jgi:hypothetical protein
VEVRERRSGTKILVQRVSPRLQAATGNSKRSPVRMKNEEKDIENGKFLYHRENSGRERRVLL